MRVGGLCGLSAIYLRSVCGLSAVYLRRNAALGKGASVMRRIFRPARGHQLPRATEKGPPLLRGGPLFRGNECGAQFAILLIIRIRLAPCVNKGTGDSVASTTSSG